MKKKSKTVRVADCFDKALGKLAKKHGINKTDASVLATTIINEKQQKKKKKGDLIPDLFI